MSEEGKVAQRAGLTALGTLCSRVLGMARESVIAASFAVAQTDAFFIAYTIPNTLRGLLAEGAVANAFIPVYASVQAERGQSGARAFVARFSGALALLLAATCVLGMVAAKPLSYAYAGGFVHDPERFALVVELTRWLFPFLLLAGLSALTTGTLNVLGRFTLPAFAPALTNVGVIVVAWFGTSLLSHAGFAPVMALAIGALLGGALTLGIQLPALSRLGMLPRPRIVLGDPDVKRALTLLVPLTLSLGINQINLMFSRLFASFLPPGAQSYLNYGQRVVEIPQGMFAMALASAALPTLSRLYAENKREELLRLFRYSLRLTFFLGLPASCLLIVLAEPTAATLFGRGAFSAQHIHETGRSLALQGAGVWAVAALRSVVPMFAAHQDTRTPVFASVINLCVFLTLSRLALPYLGHVAIALANSAASVAQLGLMLWLLRRKLGPLGLSEVLRSALRSGVAALSAGLLGFVAVSQVSWHDSGELARLLRYAAVLVASGVAFVAASWLLRAPELMDLLSALQKRRNRARRPAGHP